MNDLQRMMFARQRLKSNTVIARVQLAMIVRFVNDGDGDAVRESRAGPLLVSEQMHAVDALVMTNVRRFDFFAHNSLAFTRVTPFSSTIDNTSNLRPRPRIISSC